jgi:hypothetical protein
MKHLRSFKQINEYFRVSLNKYEKEKIESEWGMTMDDIEDILLEISDLTRDFCRINTPTYRSSFPILIVLSTVTGIKMTEYESIINRIRKKFSKYDINVEDSTIGHEKTNVDMDKYFFCLRLTKNSDLNTGPKIRSRKW